MRDYRPYGRTQMPCICIYMQVTKHRIQKKARKIKCHPKFRYELLVRKRFAYATTTTC